MYTSVYIYIYIYVWKYTERVIESEGAYQLRPCPTSSCHWLKQHLSFASADEYGILIPHT